MAWFDTGRPKSGMVKRETTVVFEEHDVTGVEAFEFGQARESEASLRSVSEVRAEVVQEALLYTESEIQRARDEAFEAGCLARAAEDEEIREGMQHTWAGQLEEVTREFYRWRLERTGQMQEALLQMTQLVSEAILGDQFHDIPQSYVHIAGQLVERAVGFETLRLQVPPEAVAYVENEVESLRRRHPDHAQIEVEADAQMSVGDCRLNIEGGVIDGSLRERLEADAPDDERDLVAPPDFGALGR